MTALGIGRMWALILFCVMTLEILTTGLSPTTVGTGVFERTSRNFFALNCGLATNPSSCWIHSETNDGPSIKIIGRVLSRLANSTL